MGRVVPSGELTGSAIPHDELCRVDVLPTDWALLQQPSPVSPATHPPSGLLAHATDAGTIAGSPDALIDAVAVIESLPGGVATHIIANPGAYAMLRQFKKDSTGSNESLLGAGTEAGPKTLLSLPVLTTSAMPTDKVLVLDKKAGAQRVRRVQVRTIRRLLLRVGQRRLAQRSDSELALSMPTPCRF